MIGQEVRARKIGWLEVGSAIKSELKVLLGKDIDCIACQEDYDYWAVRFVGYRMPIAEVEQLLEILDAGKEMRDESIPLPEDKQTTVGSIGMHMSRTLLRKAMQCDWKLELPEAKAMWLLDISE